MTPRDQYVATAQRARSSWDAAAQSWTDGVGRAAESLRAPMVRMSTFDPVAVVDQWFDAAQRVLEANRTAARGVVGAATAFDGVVREQGTAGARAVAVGAEEILDTVAETAEHQVEHLQASSQEVLAQAEATAQAQAEQAEAVAAAQAEQAEAVAAAQAEQQAQLERDARAAERRQQREVREAARAHYEGWRKADLAGELATRGLPKSGNVPDLVERLVDADIG